LNVAMMTRAALMAAVTAVAAQIAIPLPFSPVPFTQFKGGLGVVLGPTGGYLLSYPIAAAVAGLASNAARSAGHRRALWTSLLWGCVGLAVIYALGATWLAVVTRVPFAAALAQGVAPFVIFDLIKVALAALVAVAAAPAIAAASRI
jgi:biotin transport system substrate-specific component